MSGLTEKNRTVQNLYNKAVYELSKIINRRYEKKMRKKLINNNFSIICSNCIGGVIYHRLGKQFLSPTINLWMNQKDFLKMVLDLKSYMSKELVFIKGEYDYPIALLGDVKIYFNHSKTEEEAHINWERRKTRINYDNLYIIMYDRNGLTNEDFDALSKINCKNRIVLSTEENDKYSFIKKLKPHPERVNGPQCLDKDTFGIRTFEKQWDYVDWLNK